jgi:hypothetical protein
MPTYFVILSFLTASTNKKKKAPVRLARHKMHADWVFRGKPLLVLFFSLATAHCFQEKA